MYLITDGTVQQRAVQSSDSTQKDIAFQSSANEDLEMRATNPSFDKIKNLETIYGIVLNTYNSILSYEILSTQSQDLFSELFYHAKCSLEESPSNAQSFLLRIVRNIQNCLQEYIKGIDEWYKIHCNDQNLRTTLADMKKQKQECNTLFLTTASLYDSIIQLDYVQIDGMHIPIESYQGSTNSEKLDLQKVQLSVLHDFTCYPHPLPLQFNDIALLPSYSLNKQGCSVETLDPRATLQLCSEGFCSFPFADLKDFVLRTSNEVYIGSLC